MAKAPAPAPDTKTSKPKADVPEVAVATKLPPGGANMVNIPTANVSVKKGFNPCQDIGDVTALKANLKLHGVLNPITVCPTKDGADTYYVVAGHRRLSAWNELGKKNIPAVIRDIDINSPEALALAVSENNDAKDGNAGLRRGLTPTESAAAIERLIKLTGTDDAKTIGDMLGYNRVSVGRYLKIKDLPPKLEKMVSEDKVSYLAALCVLDAPEKLQAKIAEKIIVGITEAEAQKEVNKAKKEALGEKSLTPAEKKKAKPPTVTEAKELVNKATKKDKNLPVDDSTHNRPWGQRPNVVTNPRGEREVRLALLKMAKRALNSAVDMDEAKENKDDLALAKANLAYATNAAYVAALVWRYGEVDGELPDIDSDDFKAVLVDIQARLDVAEKADAKAAKKDAPEEVVAPKTEKKAKAKKAEADAE